MHSAQTRGGLSTEIQQTLTYGITFLIIGMFGSSLGPTLPALAEQTSSTLKDISILFVTRPLGMIIGSLFVGHLYDRFHGHKLLAIATIAISIFLTTFPFIDALDILAALFFLSGIASMTINIGGNTLILYVHGDKVAPYINGLHFAFSLGAFISPLLVAGVILFDMAPQSVFWLLAVFMLLPTLLLTQVPRPALPERSQEAEAAETATSGLVILFMLFFFLYVAIEASVAGWIYTYALEMEIADSVNAAYMTSAFWGTQTIGRLVAIPFAAVIRPILIVRVGVSCGLLMVVIMVLNPASAIAIWLGLLGLGLSVSALFASMLTVAHNKLPISGKTTARFFLGASLGGMVGPWIVGQFFESYGPTFLLHSICLLFIVECIVMLAIDFHKEKGGRNVDPA